MARNTYAGTIGCIKFFMRVKTEKQLKAKLDKLFSEFIRRRDADKNGIVKCCSCGKLVDWKESDCSHFVSRQYLWTRYDERNCNASCRKCNRFEEGRKEEYALFLVKKYGVEILEELNSAKWKVYPQFPYAEKILEYEEKLKELEK